MCVHANACRFIWWTNKLKNFYSVQYIERNGNVCIWKRTECVCRAPKNNMATERRSTNIFDYVCSVCVLLRNRISTERSHKKKHILTRLDTDKTWQRMNQDRNTKYLYITKSCSGTMFFVCKTIEQIKQIRILIECHSHEFDLMQQQQQHDNKSCIHA